MRRRQVDILAVHGAVEPVLAQHRRLPQRVGAAEVPRPRQRLHRRKVDKVCDKELGVDRPGESSVPGCVSGESRLAQDRRASTQSRLISSPLGEAHLASSPSVRLM